MNNYYIINFKISLFSYTNKKARNEVFRMWGQMLILTDISLKLLTVKLK